MRQKTYKKRTLRKGRCLLVASIFALSLGLFSNSLNAQAADSDDLRTMLPVTVQAGDTLWELVAENYQFQGDIRKAISEVEEINGVRNAVIQPGQVLYIPVR